jgi:hypothetical protein
MTPKEIGDSLYPSVARPEEKKVSAFARPRSNRAVVDQKRSVAEDDATRLTGGVATQVSKMDYS